MIDGVDLYDTGQTVTALDAELGGILITSFLLLLLPPPGLLLHWLIFLLLLLLSIACCYCHVRVTFSWSSIVYVRVLELSSST